MINQINKREFKIKNLSVLLVFLMLLFFIFNKIITINARSVSFVDEFSVRVYCGFNNFFHLKSLCENVDISKGTIIKKIAINNANLAPINDQLLALQAQLDDIKIKTPTTTIKTEYISYSSAPVYIIGPQGPIGERGPAGPQGPAGSIFGSGTNTLNFVPVAGPAGANGINGINGTIINWYSENVASPTVAPSATGNGSIAIGNGAQALASNMFVYGDMAGVGGSDADYSNFIGAQAGYNANASYSNFLGYYAGYSADGSFNSNFIGRNSGSGATDSYQSNFIGMNAGLNAEGVDNANFIGTNSGKNAISAGGSNFIGPGAGENATQASGSNFIGSSAGRNATNSSDSNFIGNSAGINAAGASDSNFLGSSAGENAINAIKSNFIGGSAGAFATNANDSNFFGFIAGQNATNANNSNFLGASAGQNATNANNSNFLGASAGQNATNANNSNFFGQNAGSNATAANYSNFSGVFAGANATNAFSSNFIGAAAGQNATNAFQSNFFGDTAGSAATNANNSNFSGYYSGYGATNASSSNFIGVNAGNSALNASYSNLFGYNVGNESASSSHMGPNNIIIGTNISLPNATADSINIGGVLFGTGTQNDTSTSTPYITPTATGKIGIGVVSPAYTLDVGNASTSGIVAQFTNSTGYCTINPTTTSLSCTSDINLKKNITRLQDDSQFTLSTVTLVGTSTLDKISQLDAVAYNWNTESSTSTKHTGFIAQQVEQIFPDLVTTDLDTNLKSVNYTGFAPYLVQAMRELNTNLASIKILTNALTQSGVDFNLNENVITNVKAIQSVSGNWKIGEDGLITAKFLRAEGIELKDTDGSWYCYQSQSGSLVKIGLAPCSDLQTNVNVPNTPISAIPDIVPDVSTTTATNTSTTTDPQIEIVPEPTIPSPEITPEVPPVDSPAVIELSPLN